MPTVYEHQEPDRDAEPAALRAVSTAADDVVVAPAAGSEPTVRRVAEAAATRIAINRALAERVSPEDRTGARSKSRYLDLRTADPELCDAVPGVDLASAGQALVVRQCRLKPGPLNLLDRPLTSTTFALLVIGGVVTRETSVAGRSMLELLLPGDVLLPWAHTSSAPRSEFSLSAPTEVTLAALDQRFIKASAKWPGLLVTVQQRLGEQRHRLATHGAICQLPRVEQRLMAIMWFLAARAGRVVREGTMLPWPLSHQALAGLVGASRPTVSLALSVLQARGYLFRRPDRNWVLAGVLEESASFEELLAGISAL